MAQHEAATKDDTDSQDESATEDNTTHARTSAGDGESPVEVTEEAKEKAHKMAEAFEEKPTAVLPASNNTVTGTAINAWLDEDGNSKFSDKKDGKDANEDDAKES